MNNHPNKPLNVPAPIDFGLPARHPLIIVELLGLPRCGKTSIARALSSMWPSASDEVPRVVASSDRGLAREIKVPYADPAWQGQLAQGLAKTVLAARELHAQGLVDVLVLDRGYHDMLQWVACGESGLASVKTDDVVAAAVACGGFNVIPVVVGGVRI